ncbi:MAG: TetR/AcrR family transcriptional regulator [Acidimicrobiales bacterium]|nr:TetR/AcrR family transcriptional regulator [Acidimicrobiales bacterium]
MSRATEKGTPQPGGRELRSQGRQTMAKLLDAGIQVLQTRGYHAARVDDIVRIAKVSHGTFYLYFANKEDLFRALAVQCADEMTELAKSLGQVDPGPAGVDDLSRWIARFIACYRKYGVVIRAWMEDQVSTRELSRLGIKTFNAVVSALVNRIEEARPGDHHQAEVSAAALLAMLERFTYFVTSRNLAFDDEAMVDTLAVLIHRGFFAAKPAAAA